MPWRSGNTSEGDALLDDPMNTVIGHSKSHSITRRRWILLLSMVAATTLAAATISSDWRAPTLGQSDVLDPPSALTSFQSEACQWRLDRAARENARCNPRGTDVVVIPALKAVYVDVTKAASESVRHRLLTVFNASWTAGQSVQMDDEIVDDGNYLARTTTASVSEEVLDTYTFFTFIRNPAQRFVSGYRQAFCRPMCQGCERGKSPTRPPTIEQTIDLLEISRAKSMQDELFCAKNGEDAVHSRSFLNNPWLDEHMQSATFRLSGLSRRGTRIPIHFIGRVESLNEDWQRLLDTLDVAQNHESRAPLDHIEHTCSLSERERYLDAQARLFSSHLTKGVRAPLEGDLYEPVSVIYDSPNVVKIPNPSTATGKYYERFKTLFEDDYRCFAYE